MMIYRSRILPFLIRKINRATIPSSPSSVSDEIANRPDSSEPIPCVVCGREIFTACVNCSAVVCYDHFFEENVDCAEDNISLGIIHSNLENNLPANSEPESCVVCGREKF